MIGRICFGIPLLLLERPPVEFSPISSEVRSSSFGRMDQGIAKAIRMRALMSLAAYDEALIGEVGMQSKRHCYEESCHIHRMSLIRTDKLNIIYN